MHSIQLKVQSYLQSIANGGASALPTALVEEYAKACSRSLKRQLGEPRRPFGLSMSAVGKPYCQLWHDKAGTVGMPSPYTSPMVGLMGDNLEAMAIAIMTQAGVNIVDTFVNVKLEIGGINAAGTLDIILDEEGVGVWDIKSASSYSFGSKFNSNFSFKDFMEDDVFGYAVQGVCYATAKKLPFKGWIVLNKDTAEWTVREFDQSYTEQCLEIADTTIRKITSNAPFEKCFDDVAEVFKRKPTGNRHLQTACSYCKYKLGCWPGVKYTTNPLSTAAIPGYKWYTEMKDKEDV